MKIGILTQPLLHNYGGILQNWSLQQVLRRLGHEPEMIFLDEGSRPHGKLLAMRCMSYLKCLIKRKVFGRRDVYLHPVLNPRYNPDVPEFADCGFVKKIRKTRRLFADEDLTKYTARRNYDAFIVGSDQVWREEYSPDILAYFLKFLTDDDKRPKVAYAASFGKNRDFISADKMPECRRLLGRFKAVSVRENEGIEIVRSIFGRSQVEKVLDPTLLLTQSDFLALISPQDRHNKPHITSYILDRNVIKSTILDEVKDELKLPCCEMGTNPGAGQMPGFSRWLANFADASFVVTDSFHGCVFSIIFEKPFIVIANAERGLDRFRTLLGEFGLSDRLLNQYTEFTERKAKLLSSPDYAFINGLLEASRRDSLKFLRDALA